MRVLSVVGNRPQFVKSAPLSLALRDAGIDESVLHTGQHWDPGMSEVFFRELGLEEPAYRLDARSADIDAMLPGIRRAVEREQPDWVLVFGDTNSTVAGARAAGEVPVAHVEAGLRSFDLSMPEERNRIEVDAVAALLLCPDAGSAAQLRSEGRTGRIEVVGDVMADAVRLFLPIARREQSAFAPPFDVLTLHRAANTEPAQLRGLLEAVASTGRRTIFPIHPRTRRVLEQHGQELAPSIEPVEPLGYLEMLALVSAARVVLTDSGGLQKEAYWLGVPCVTLRDTTEWGDTVRAGANRLVDPADPHDLAAAVGAARFPADAPPLYGDGHAAGAIAAALYPSRP